ncbi:MAG: response regulator, partial [Candidatus Omnitrophica bacterium]|nr:response regulator [Candidatus Omnitrophota bacterium]
VVDDEKEIVSILDEFLRKNGYDVISASSGEKALEMINSGAAFDGAILDIRMPKVDGIALLKKLKERSSKVPVFILSGSVGAEAGQKQLEELGYAEQDILYKPVDLKEILSKIKERVG